MAEFACQGQICKSIRLGINVNVILVFDRLKGKTIVLFQKFAQLITSLVEMGRLVRRGRIYSMVSAAKDATLGSMVNTARSMFVRGSMTRFARMEVYVTKVLRMQEVLYAIAKTV